MSPVVDKSVSVIAVLNFCSLSRSFKLSCVRDCESMFSTMPLNTSLKSVLKLAIVALAQNGSP